MTIKYWYIPALLFMLVACKRKDNNYNTNQFGDKHTIQQKDVKDLYQLIEDARRKIKDGDLIMRADDGLESESMRNFSQKDKTFSHCGLAFIEDSQVYVYNAIAGVDNPSEKLLREPFDSFVNPEMKKGFGIYRYTLTDGEINSLHGITREFYSQGILFDKAFDLKTDDKLYCAELVYKLIKKATGGGITLPTSMLQNYKLKAPNYNGKVLKEFEYVGLDDLYLNPFCQHISTISY